MKKITALVYGFVCYALGMASFVYLGASLVGVGVPNAIDAPRTSPLGLALAGNVLLIGLFALQHSAMARPGFKQRWTRWVPPALERSTYVLFSAAALGLLLRLWQPLGGPIWHVVDPVGRALLFGLYGAGWVGVVAVTFAIHHFDLFGLRQVVVYAQGREYTPLPFGTPGPYRWVRHPLYVGWLVVFWATPVMTLSHLVLASLVTAYILFAIQFEERDLVAHFGDRYADYRREVPMLVPGGTPLRLRLPRGEPRTEPSR
jgi:protein-S-isoprenylcysteine O-methyltransferase Ste14